MVKKLVLFTVAGFLFLAACKPAKTTEADTAAPTPAEQKQTTPFQEITVAGLKQMKEGTAKPQILDVRTPEEVAAGSIAGATVIDIYDPAFMDKVKALDKNQPTIVYCKVGGRSAQACTLMSEAGFTKLYNLTGGYDAWKTQP